MDSFQLKPCPACGASVKITGGDEWHNQHEFWICCENKECGCVRVGDTEREECIRRWNCLPRALKWTEKAPIELGYYWVSTKTGFSSICRQSDPDEIYEHGQYGVEIVEVFEEEDGKKYVRFCGWDIPSPFEMVAKNSYFAGPIRKPRGD